MQRYHSMRDAYQSIYEKKDSMKDAPSIKDHKEPKKVNVKYDKDMGVMAPTVKEAIDVLIDAGLLDEEEVGILNERLNPFQVTFDKDGKEEDRKKRDSTPAAKKAAKKYAKNADDNRKKGPMAYNPYGKND